REPEATRRRGWPGSPRALSAELRRLAPALRGLGVTVKFDREPDRGRRRVICLEAQGGASDRPNRPLAAEEPVAGPSAAFSADDSDGVDGSDANLPAPAPPEPEVFDL